MPESAVMDDASRRTTPPIDFAPKQPKLWHQQHMLETNPRFGPVLFGPAELNLERLYSTILSEALVL